MPHRKNPEITFIPIKFNSYKTSKINTLKSQLKITSLIIHAKKIEELHKRKDYYKKELKHKLSSTIKDIQKIKTSLPSIKEEKHTTHHATHHNNTHNIQIDKELAEIQRKLKNLKI